MEDDESQLPKAKMFFGRNLLEIPCFRKTFLTSISSGLVLGFAYFMFTSKTKQAINVAYFSFFSVTLGHWIYCRYNWAYDKQNVQKLLLAAKHQSMFEGTTDYDKRGENDETNLKEA